MLLKNANIDGNLRDIQIENGKIAKIGKIENYNGEIIDIISDESCLCKDSFLSRAGIYHEEQDERLEIVDFSMPDYKPEGWKKAEVHDALDAKYILNECPPDRIIKYITPVLIKETENEKIYDCKENTTGFPIVIGKGKEGASSKGEIGGDKAGCNRQGAEKQVSSIEVF